MTDLRTRVAAAIWNERRGMSWDKLVTLTQNDNAGWEHTYQMALRQADVVLAMPERVAELAVVEAARDLERRVGNGDMAASIEGTIELFSALACLDAIREGTEG